MSKFVYTVETHGQGKVKKQTFDGFRRLTGEATPRIIGIVFDYGEVEIWELENAFASVEELQRMYRMLYNSTPTVHIYKVP